ncbi:hypothetical protein D3C72_2161040 [compost metagenome]
MADHVLDVLGGLGVDVGPADVEGVRVEEELAGEALGEGVPGLACERRVADDLVVHVGEVLGVLDPVARMLEVAAHHVPGDEAAQVAQVDEVVHRRTADVHGHVRGVLGREGLQLMGPIVVHA